jgi:hypothetical protein
MPVRRKIAPACCDAQSPAPRVPTPYGVRPGTGRPGPTELWERFDMAVLNQNHAITGSNVIGVARAFGALAAAAARRSGRGRGLRRQRGAAAARKPFEIHPGGLRDPAWPNAGDTGHLMSRKDGMSEPQSLHGGWGPCWLPAHAGLPSTTLAFNAGGDGASPAQSPTDRRPLSGSHAPRLRTLSPATHLLAWKLQTK